LRKSECSASGSLSKAQQDWYRPIVQKSRAVFRDANTMMFDRRKMSGQVQQTSISAETVSQQPVVKGQRRTEAGEAPYQGRFPQGTGW
jgi:hypothetical protein